MRPTPIGPRTGLPPEMATPLTLIGLLWGGLALAALGWASAATVAWTATRRWDPPPFTLDTATQVLHRGPGPAFGAPTAAVTTTWAVLSRSAGPITPTPCIRFTLLYTQ